MQVIETWITLCKGNVVGFCSPCIYAKAEHNVSRSEAFKCVTKRCSASMERSIEAP